MPGRQDGIRVARNPRPALVHSGSDYDGEPSVITKKLFSAAIGLGAAVGVATPASADPSSFGTLSCNCEVTVSDGGAAVTDQMNQGIQSGLAYLQGGRASGNSAPSQAAAPDRSSR